MATRIVVRDKSKDSGRERRAQSVSASELPPNRLDARKPEVLAEFPAFLSGYTGDKWDNLVLTIVVPRAHKYDGMKVTDHRGVMFMVTVEGMELDLDAEPDVGGDALGVASG